MTAHSASSTFASHVVACPWATSSYPSAVDASENELSALGSHVGDCNGSRGRWFTLQCAADSFLNFAASRLVTTVVLVAFVFGVVSILA